MPGMFDNFTNINTSFMQNLYQSKHPSINSTQQVLETSPNKPYEVKNPDGSLKGYFWYKGNSILLVFNIEGEITLSEYDTYVTFEDVLRMLNLTATFYNFRHEPVVTFDTFAGSEHPIICKPVINNGVLDGTVVTIEIDKELSNTKFVKGIYYLDLVASHPSGYCETLFGSDTCTFEVK